MARDMENQKRLAREWYLKNRELAKTRAKEWAAANPEKRKEIYTKYRDENREKHSAYNKEWFANNPAKRSAYEAKRKADKAHRTPSWLTEDDFFVMEEAYELAQLRTTMFGFPWHVDHVIPLRGKKVSGLHTPSNLQVIPGTENCRKNATYVVT